MISMFIDTSSFNIIIAIYSDDQEIVCNMEKNDHSLSERIMPLLDKTLKEAKIDLDKIDKIFVVNGPGSFTGIRIGVAVAKTIAYAMNKKIYPISELEVLSSGASNLNASFIDARRGYVYAGIYDQNLNCKFNDIYMPLNDFMKYCNEKGVKTYTSYDEIPINNLKTPKINIQKIIKKHLNDKDVVSHMLNPNYLKLTEAEEKLNDQINNRS